MQKDQAGTTKMVTGLENMPDSKDTRSLLQLMRKKAAGRFVCSQIRGGGKFKKKNLFKMAYKVTRVLTD